MVLIGLRILYSWPNIDAENNSFEVSTDSGITWTTLHLPEGAYELESIDAEIYRQIAGNGTINITANLATL